MNLILVVLLAGLSTTSVFGSRVVTSLTAIHLGATPAVVGAIMSLYFLVPMVLGLLMGRLVDRAGVALPMALVACLLAAGNVLPAAFPSLWALAISAACIGTAFVGAMIALSSAAAFVGGPQDRAANFSWFTIGTGLGVGLGPLLTGFAIDGLGDRAASLSLCVWPAAVLVLLAAKWRHLPTVTSVTSVPASARGPKLSWTSLFSDRRLRAVLVGSVMCPAGYEVFLFVIPVNGTRIGMSASTIGSVLGVSAAAIFLVRMATPFLVRRMHEWTIMMVVLLGIGASYLMLVVFTQSWAIFLVGAVMGIVQGVGQPVIMSMYFTASPAGRQGEAAGVRGILQNACSAFSPVFIGGLGTILGLGPVLVAAAAVYAWGGWFSRRQRALWGPR